MPNLTIISFSLYVCGLIVRDECERSVKIQALKDEQVDFTTVSHYATRVKSHE